MHVAFCLGLLPTLFLAANALAGPKEKVLFAFSGSGSSLPAGTLVAGANGVLFGATEAGIGGQFGSVFELVPPAKGGTAWTQTVLHGFSGPEGAAPLAGLTTDASGNLYGTAAFGGDETACPPPNGAPFSGCGVVFELSPGAGTDSYIYTVLHVFHGGQDGSAPLGLVVHDTSGNLYTTTYAGGGGTCTTDGNAGCGTVIELSKPAHEGGDWKETVLFRFTGGAGENPIGIAIDSTNVLTVVAQYGGPYHDGTVIRLVPPAMEGGKWTSTFVHAFDGRDGAYPVNPPGFDAAGNIYITTAQYGVGFGGGNGTVIRLSPRTGGKTGWQPAVLHRFMGGSDGASPETPVVLSNGKLLFATYGGGITA